MNIFKFNMGRDMTEERWGILRRDLRNHSEHKEMHSFFVKSTRKRQEI